MKEQMAINTVTHVKTNEIRGTTTMEKTGKMTLQVSSK